MMAFPACTQVPPCIAAMRATQASLHPAHVLLRLSTIRTWDEVPWEGNTELVEAQCCGCGPH